MLVGVLVEVDATVGIGVAIGPVVSVAVGVGVGVGVGSGDGSGVETGSDIAVGLGVGVGVGVRVETGVTRRGTAGIGVCVWEEVVSAEVVGASVATVAAGVGASVVCSCSGVVVRGGDCCPPQAERAIRAAKMASSNAAVCPHLVVLNKPALIWTTTALWLKGLD